SGHSGHLLRVGDNGSVRFPPLPPQPCGSWRRYAVHPLPHLLRLLLSTPRRVLAACGDRRLDHNPVLRHAAHRPLAFREHSSLRNRTRVIDVNYSCSLATTIFAEPEQVDGTPWRPRGGPGGWGERSQGQG